MKADWDLSANWSITFANWVARIVEIILRNELIKLIGLKSLTKAEATSIPSRERPVAPFFLADHKG